MARADLARADDEFALSLIAALIAALIGLRMGPFRAANEARRRAHSARMGFGIVGRPLPRVVSSAMASRFSAWIEWHDARGETHRLVSGGSIDSAPWPVTEISTDGSVRGLPFRTLALLERVYAEYPEEARRIVRHRIFTNEPDSLPLRELIRVAAKRVTVVGSEIEVPSEIIAAITSATEREPLAPAPSSSLVTFGDGDRAATFIAMRSTPVEDAPWPPHARDRAVQCALAVPGAQNARVFRNQNARVKPWHAEMLLLRAHDYRIPAGSQLLSSLKPCRMCAAWILACAAPPHRHPLVVYHEEDPGRWARGTALDAVPGLQIRL